MNSCVVIGNGTSRLQFDLNIIGDKFTTYGCNALYRDYMPDYLVSIDWFMVDEIVKAKAHYKTKLFAQHDNNLDKLSETEPINFVEITPDTVDSGHSAINLAASHRFDTVYMIGFDYIVQGKINNVYAGTRNYARKNAPQVQTLASMSAPSRMKNYCKRYPDTKFIRVNGNNYNLPIDEPNFINITPEEFNNILKETN